MNDTNSASGGVKLDSRMSHPSLARRLADGWSANTVQLALALTQQLFLVPVFLHFWNPQTLAAWLALYAASALAQAADCGLQTRAINRFMALKACSDCNGRTSNFYWGVLQVYIGIVLIFSVLLVTGILIFRPSSLLGFGDTATFDSAFAVMTVGTLAVLPSGLVTGLYRVHGRYARGVWLQNGTNAMSQIAQVVAVVMFGSVLAVAIAYAVTWLSLAIFLLTIDVRNQFPSLQPHFGWRSWRWSVGQVKLALPFGLAAVADLSLVNLPVLMVSVFVPDRLAVAQWGLTRAVAGLVRAVPALIATPLAPEIAHEYAVGSRQRCRRLYSRASVFVTAFGCVIAAGFLSFWADFFTLWTHGNIPYDKLTAVALLIGSALVAPSILAVYVAAYTNRGVLLMQAKGLQLTTFLILGAVAIPAFGPPGAAFAILATDLIVQSGLLARVILKDILKRPLLHAAYLALLAGFLLGVGWAVGSTIAAVTSGTGVVHFALECATWLIVPIILAGLLRSGRVLKRLTDSIPD